MLQIIIDPLVLVKQGLIAPQRSCNSACRDNTSDQLTSRPGQLVNGTRVRKHLKENSAWRNRLELVREVCLPGVSPAIHIEWLKLKNKRPLRVWLFLATLGMQTPVHD